MKTVFEHIDHVKGKPHHIRKKVAFSAAGVVTGLVAVVWLGSSLATNAFAIQGSTFSQSVGQSDGLKVDNKTNSQNLAGVAAAALFGDTPEPAHIEIVNVAPTSTAQSHASEETTIPF